LGGGVGFGGSGASTQSGGSGGPTKSHGFSTGACGGWGNR
jgi:hypothetical protein